MNPEINNSAEPGKPAGAGKSPEPTLEGWKEIATFLKRDVRTVMRWEKGESLPVRRHLHNQRSSVYALPSELKAWQAARAPQPVLPQRVAWWRPRPALGLAAAIFLLMVSFRGGPLAELQAQAQTNPAPTVTEVYPDLQLDSMGSISSDGKRYAGTDWQLGELAVWDLASAKMTHLNDSGNYSSYVQWPRWSPDGERIAYQFCPYNGGCRLNVIKADGGKPEISYKPDERTVERVMGWSPDGKTILCGLQDIESPEQKPKHEVAETRRQKFVLAAFDVATQRLTDLAEVGGRWAVLSAQFSPDGKSIAHVAIQQGKPHIRILSLSTGAETAVPGGDVRDRAPIWTLDGKRLLFASDRSGRWDLWSVEIADGKPVGSPTMLYPEIGDFLEFNGWRDDHSLLYAKSTVSGNLYTAPIDPASGTVGDPQTPVPYFVGQHSAGRWSPDGKNVLLSVRGKGFFVYTRSTKSLRQIDVQMPSVSLYIPGWYPAGDAVGLWSMKAATLYRVSLSSGKTEAIYSDKRAYGPGHLSADGTIVAYIRNSDTNGASKAYSSVCLYDLKQRRMLKEIPAPAASYYSTPELSADAKWVFYAEIPRSTGGRQRILTAPVGSGAPRTVVEIQPGIQLDSGAVSPDGQYLLYSTSAAAAASASGPGKPPVPRVFLAEINGGAPQEVRFPASYHGGFLYWSSDGKQVSYIGDQSNTQFFALSNFLPQDGTKQGQ